MQAISPFRQRELRQVLRKSRKGFCQINLDFLAGYDVDQALNCLKQIQGVGSKIAAATLNLRALRMRALVADAYVTRVLQRFGLPICMSRPLSDICRRGAENLTALKTFLDKPELKNAPIRTPLGHGEADLCLRGGIQHGVLHEVFAVKGYEAAATGFAAGLATRVAAGKHVLWIRQDFSAHEYGELSATGLVEFGFDPARILLLAVNSAGDGLRAANDALSCSALGALVIEIPGSPKILDLVASRRLTLSATKKSVTPFLLRFNAPSDASTAETRWLVRAAISQAREDDWGYPAFEASLVRNRHGKTGHWFMEWNCDECVFQKAAADHGAMVSAAAD